MTNLYQEKIAVLHGGNSAERDVSLRSGKAIAKGLIASGFNISLIDTKDYCLSDLSTLGIDRAFIALHGRGGEDGCVQGALEYMNIPYTGSGVLGSALSMDKIRSKQIFQSLGLPTAAFCIVDRENYNIRNAATIIEQLHGKAMVKPAHEGSSIGMAMADSSESLDAALQAAFAFDQEILVEAWINGPEYTVAILGNEALPAIHMETPREFYDYTAKYQSDTTQYHCPSGLPVADEEALQALALKAFNATGAIGWGRVDIMRSQQGQWQVLEVNTVPGMTETSLVPKAAKEYGLNFNALVSKILMLSVKDV